ncbi:MAG: cytochrome c oxidase subunit 3 [Planctomycetota bacterium]
MSDAHAHDHSGDHDHPAHLAHHFETPEQQMESGKLGMWVFLATEILMFGGLFCAYAVYRANNPDVFLFAHKALDTTWGAVNTIVLLASSFTMAWGVRAAQLGQKGILVTMLSLTLLGGAGFMVIKTIEYSSKWEHDLWVGGLNAFYQDSGTLLNPDEAEHTSQDYIEKKAGHKSDGHGHGHGEKSSAHTAANDHGAADAEHHDEEHAEPPTVVAESAAVSVVEVSTVVRPKPPAAGLVADLVENPHPNIEGAQNFYKGVGAVQAAHHGSHYPRFEELDAIDKDRTHIFFQIYFMMTGLHGIHVLVGMGLITWILVKSINNVFSPAYYTPVDLVGLYWHLVDLIWIFLFPLLYLIH